MIFPEEWWATLSADTYPAMAVESVVSHAVLMIEREGEYQLLEVSTCSAWNEKDPLAANWERADPAMQNRQR